MISIHTNNQPGGQVIITAETCCTDCDDVEILVGYLGEYWDCGDGYYMASPNPADRYIDIDVDQEKMTAEDSSPGSECVLKMVDKTGMVKYTDEFREFPYRINTSNLPEGPYIINLIREGKMFSIQVIIEH